MKTLPWIVGLLCLTPAWFYLVHYKLSESPKITVAQKLYDTALLCRESVKDGEDYGSSHQCQQLSGLVSGYYAAGKSYSEDYLLFYRAQCVAWEALAISNALYPERVEVRVW